MKYYSFNLGDYYGNTTHITWDEDAAYRKLIDWYYSLEGPLPDDPRAIYRKIKADTEERRAACDAVLGEFFTLTEGGFRHQKCEERIAKFYKTSKSASERGKAGAEIKKAKAKLNDGKNKQQPTDYKQQLPNAAKSPPDAVPNTVFDHKSEGEGGIKAKSTTQDKLQLNGGQAVADKTQATHNPLPITHNPTTPTPSGMEVKDGFEVLDKTLRAIPGVEKHPVFSDAVIAPIWQLVQAGYHVQTQIIPSIKMVVATARPGTIDRWSYFVKRIKRDADATSDGNGHVHHAETEEISWDTRMWFARKNKTWDTGKWGPWPNQPGCLVPPALIQPDDGKGWTEWKPPA